MDKTKLTNEIILSNDIEDFKTKLYSEPSDYSEINLVELIQEAKSKGIKIIKCIRTDFLSEDIKTLASLDVFADLYMGSTWFYTLILGREEYDIYLKRKEEHFIEQFNAFKNMEWIR